ncbi:MULTISPECIES: response regulator [Paenibacillus]|jgi:two-component system response regulator YesN|uniref:response regulator n=1 Tax=Paenibacillus TaxID=44249 RepID=UPI0001AFD1CA|nr:MULTISPECIES: response regulator [Paenibacillus]EES74103.1 response regulator receiver domain protein [Paenibacillus sp. oral taxon 786 str. D14]
MLRIAIVDDEASIREGLGKMIGKESGKFVVEGLFPHGQDLLNRLLLRQIEIDVIITDIRMPVVDGLELIKQVKDLRPDIRCILMSGFTDFEYARQALRCSAVDYLLKPINKKQLFALLYNLEQEQAARRSKEQYLRMGLLLTYLQSSPSLCTKLPKLTLPTNSYFVLVLKGVDPVTLRTGLDRLGTGDSPAWDLVDTEDQALALVCYTPAEPEEADIRGFTDRLRAGLPASRILAGSSSAYRDPACLSQAYAEAKRACELGVYGESAWNYHPVTELPEREPKAEISEWFAGYRDELSQQLQILDIAWTTACLERLFEQLRQNRASVELVLLVCRLMLETAAAELHEWSKLQSQASVKMLETKLSSCLRFHDMQTTFIAEFTGVLKQIRDARLAQAGKSVETVKRWIAEHYDQPAELSHLASLVYLTPSYLSKRFKSETGMTITDYLIEVRIKKAKQLLRQANDLKVHEVGSVVGYPDPAYFNKLFKRIVGVTPNEYKRLSQ